MLLGLGQATPPLAPRPPCLGPSLWGRGLSPLKSTLAFQASQISQFLLSLNITQVIISLIFLLKLIHFLKTSFIQKGNFLLHLYMESQPQRVSCKSHQHEHKAT